MVLSCFRMLINELLKKYPDKVLEEDPLINFYSNFSVCMDNIGMDTKHKIHIIRRVYFVRNGEKW